MDRKLVSAPEHEIEYLARKHGTSVEKVKEIIQQTGSRSREEQIEAALDKQFQHVQRKPAKRLPKDLLG
jgi:DNA-binding transcriptional MerR regulator